MKSKKIEKKLYIQVDTPFKLALSGYPPYYKYPYYFKILFFYRRIYESFLP